MSKMSPSSYEVSTELLTRIAEKDITLAGVLWTPLQKDVRTGILLASGNGDHFFTPFFIALGLELARSGYMVLSMDRRDAGEEFGYHNMEPSAMDHRYAVDELERRGCSSIIMGGHSYGTITAPYYVRNTDDPRVKALLLYAPLGDLRSASVAICGGQERYDEYTLKAQKAVERGKGHEAFMIPPMVAGMRPMVITHEVFLNKRGPQSRCVAPEIFKNITGRPILGIRDPGDPFPATLPPTEENLLKANSDLEYILLPDKHDGQISADYHFFVDREVEVAGITIDWLAGKDLSP